MKLRLLMNHAESVNNDLQDEKYIDLVGMNLRKTEMQATVAREQLKRLAGIIEQYQENAKHFDIPVRPNCTSAYYKYASPKIKENPNSEKFYMKHHYITPLYRIPKFRSLGYQQNQCPVCEAVERNIKLAWLKEVL
jgi:dTDP-4-amino-4,6-dideoxygalactose transaminase